MILFWFIYKCFYILNLFFKKTYFQIIFVICEALYNFFIFYLIQFFSSVFISIIIRFNKKIILINKFSKYKQIMFNFSRSNILIYICLSIFPVMLLVIIKFLIYTQSFFYVKKTSKKLVYQIYDFFKVGFLARCPLHWVRCFVRFYWRKEKVLKVIIRRDLNRSFLGGDQHHWWHLKVSLFFLVLRASIKSELGCFWCFG
jgi:hypothetical protein